MQRTAIIQGYGNDDVLPIVELNRVSDEYLRGKGVHVLDVINEDDYGKFGSYYEYALFRPEVGMTALYRMPRLKHNYYLVKALAEMNRRDGLLWKLIVVDYECGDEGAVVTVHDIDGSDEVMPKESDNHEYDGNAPF